MRGGGSSFRGRGGGAHSSHGSRGGSSARGGSRGGDGGGRGGRGRGGRGGGGGSDSRGARGGGFRGGRGGSREAGQKRGRASYEDADDDAASVDDSAPRLTSTSSSFDWAAELREHEAAEALEEEQTRAASKARVAKAAATSLPAQHAALLKRMQREQEGREDEEEDDEDEDGEGENGSMVDDDDEGEEGEDDEDADAEEEAEPEDGGAPAKRRKKHTTAAAADGEDDDAEDGEDAEGEDDAEGEAGEDDESEDEPDVEGNDVLSDDDEEAEAAAAASSSSHKKGKKAHSSPSHSAPAFHTIEMENARELASPDIFVRKYSHGLVYDENQCAILELDSASWGKRCPFKKAPSSIRGIREMVFVAGDATVATPEPVAAAGAASASAASSSLHPSKLTSLPPVSPLELPASSFSPPTSLSDPSLHVRPKLVDTWRRGVVEPERVRLNKQHKKGGAKKAAADEDEEDLAAAAAAAAMADEEESSAPSLIAKDAKLTPPTPKACLAGPDCLGCFACSDFYSPLQSSFFQCLTSYRDLVFSHSNAHVTGTIHQALALHVLNHLTKSRENVLKHNAILKAEAEAEADRVAAERERKAKERLQKQRWTKMKKSGDESQIAQARKEEASAAAELLANPPPPAAIPSEFRDQGFTRPKVLVLLPTAKLGGEFITKLLGLIPPKQRAVQSKLAKFHEEFTARPEDRCHPRRPFDYKLLFDGKDNDAFRIGMSFGQKQVKFYADFYTADLIVCSPLGLRLITGSEGDKPSDRDVDFLSSIELLIIDQFDVQTSMQNADHLQTIMEVLNHRPYDTKTTDFARVRDWFLKDGDQAHLASVRSRRQTVVVSNHPSMLLQQFQATWLRNSDGRLQFRAAYKGILARVIPQVKQIFQRIHCDSITELADARFDYFVSTVLPALKTNHGGSGHVLIYIPSYFDFVRLRNYAKARHLSCVYCSEFTSNSMLSRGRSSFFHGEVKFMLVTERFHFFKRYALRGVEHVIFYGLPTYEQFYVDFLNLLPTAAGGAHAATVMALYSKFDSMELERIIGTQRTTKLMQAHTPTTMFC